jgi:hypothetical protein
MLCHRRFQEAHRVNQSSCCFEVATRSLMAVVLLTLTTFQTWTCQSYHRIIPLRCVHPMLEWIRAHTHMLRLLAVTERWPELEVTCSPTKCSPTQNSIVHQELLLINPISSSPTQARQAIRQWVTLSWHPAPPILIIRLNTSPLEIRCPSQRKFLTSCSPTQLTCTRISRP